MHDGVDAVVPVVDAGERLEHLAVVGEVDPDGRRGGGVGVGHPVQRDDVVAVLGQVPTTWRPSFPLLPVTATIDMGPS